MRTIVPYKIDPVPYEEYAFRLYKGELNELAFTNWKNSIEDVFAADKKRMDDAGTIAKLENTIRFLEQHKEKQKE